VLLAWPTHSASDSPIGTDDLVGMVDPRVSQANIQVTICRRLDADRAARAVTDAIKRNLADNERGERAFIQPPLATSEAKAFRRRHREGGGMARLIDQRHPATAGPSAAFG
jgi:hypothetical protein